MEAFLTNVLALLAVPFPAPYTLLRNCRAAGASLGPLSIPMSILVISPLLCGWTLLKRGVEAAVSGALSRTLLTQLLLPVVSASMGLIMFATYFIILLESSPPESSTIVDFTVFMVPVFLAPSAPLMVSFVLGAPTLALLLTSAIPIGFLCWPHSSQVVRLMVLYIKAKINSEGRTREMLDNIMGRVQPSKLVPVLLEYLLVGGLLNYLTTQGLYALLLSDKGTEGGTWSAVVYWFVWPLLYSLVFVNMRSFLYNLANLSAGLVHLGVRFIWLCHALETYPGPLVGRVSFVLRGLISYCQDHWVSLRWGLRYLPNMALYALFRLFLPPAAKSAVMLMLATFGFYQSCGIMRFPDFNAPRDQPPPTSSAARSYASVTESSLETDRASLVESRFNGGARVADVETERSLRQYTQEVSQGEASDQTSSTCLECTSEQCLRCSHSISAERTVDETLVSEISSNLGPTALNDFRENSIIEDVSDTTEQTEDNDVGQDEEPLVSEVNEQEDEIIAEAFVRENPQGNERSRGRNGTLMDSINSLLGNAGAIPRGLSRVHEERLRSSSQSLLLAFFIVLRGHEYVSSVVSEADRLQVHTSTHSAHVLA
jgi:hypothetical protein